MIQVHVHDYLGVGSSPINCIYCEEIIMGNVALYLILLLVMVYIFVTSLKKYKKTDSVRDFISLCLSGVIMVAVVVIMLSVWW